LAATIVEHLPEAHLRTKEDAGRCDERPACSGHGSHERPGRQASRRSLALPACARHPTEGVGWFRFSARGGCSVERALIAGSIWVRLALDATFAASCLRVSIALMEILVGLRMDVA
jgi:hypothetical protein